MKKPIILTAAGVVLCVFVLVRSDVIESLLLFWLVGAVPGTPFALPPSAMLVLIFSIAWVLAFRVAIRPIARHMRRHGQAKKRAAHKKRMPTRRFKQIETTS